MIDRLVREHGSPLWLVDLDRVRDSVREFWATWAWAWHDTQVAYSYKTNRLPAILRAVADEGAAPEVVCWAEYELARRFGGGTQRAIVNGPVKPDRLLEAAAADGALVIADSVEELPRAAAAGVHRIGLRVAIPGVGVGATRFGIEAGEIGPAARAARSLGMTVEVLAAHVVSTGLREALEEASHLGAAVLVDWPPSTERHVDAAALVAGLAVEAGVEAVDLGGGHPAPFLGYIDLDNLPPPDVAEERGSPRPDVGPLFDHANAVAGALHASGFAGRLILEPGRAVVADAVDLALTVAAVKTLEDGTRCAIVDGGTNLLPGAFWGWPHIEAAGASGSRRRTLVTGPLCLNVDVLHPAAELPPLEPGDLLIARGVGAYQQSQSTQFGDLRPAVVAYDDGRWALAQRSESIEDVIAGDLAAGPAPAGASIEEERP